MGQRRAEIQLDYDAKRVTMTFADDAALALSMGKHEPEPGDRERQFERTRDGAFAFRVWAEHLLLTYFEERGVKFGQPETIDKK